MENVITEFRVIETDDGYRIEIKGDKEQLKAFMKQRGPMGRAWRRGRGRGFGPWGFGPMMWMHMAPWWDEEEAE